MASSSVQLSGAILFSTLLGLRESGIDGQRPHEAADVSLRPSRLLTSPSGRLPFIALLVVGKVSLPLHRLALRSISRLLAFNFIEVVDEFDPPLGQRFVRYLVELGVQWLADVLERNLPHGNSSHEFFET